MGTAGSTGGLSVSLERPDADAGTAGAAGAEAGTLASSRDSGGSARGRRGEGGTAVPWEVGAVAGAGAVSVAAASLLWA